MSVLSWAPLPELFTHVALLAAPRQGQHVLLPDYLLKKPPLTVTGDTSNTAQLPAAKYRLPWSTTAHYVLVRYSR